LLLPGLAQAKQEQDARPEENQQTQTHAVAKTADQKPAADTTVWIDNKVNPATRWLEDAVQPLTVWMEKKIQRRLDDEPLNPILIAPNQKQALDPSEASISPEQAATIASQAFPGEILRTTLLPKQPKQYRVKLISPAGEIHLIYIHAETGLILKPKPKQL